jgi:hypothetical protein
MIKEFLRYLYHTTTIGKQIIRGGLDLSQYFWTHFVSDKYYVRRRFKEKMGYELNLDNPETLNEKINWLKVNARTELHTQCSDKFAVREYVKNKVGDKYLVPLYLMTKNVIDIDPSKLPAEPFIIKTNHDSGGGVVVKDKSEINWADLRKKMNKRLRKNYYYKSKEWQYKNIQPCIIVEKLLAGESGGLPFDYKLHCFNGKVNMIQVDTGRYTDNHHRNWYNKDWIREPYKWSSKIGVNKFTDPSEEDVQKPRNLQLMITLSEVLAEEFDYARVDWYDVEGQLFFGEITFHHDGGVRPIIPHEWDRILGQRLKLSPINKV